jgi:hypothetical protein
LSRSVEDAVPILEENEQKLLDELSSEVWALAEEVPHPNRGGNQLSSERPGMLR